MRASNRPMHCSISWASIPRTQGSAAHDESKDAEEAAAEEEDAEASHAVDDNNGVDNADAEEEDEENTKEGKQTAA
ncbi:unnamed protein product [Phytophthora fragariaefolia]|uniref:Unnamed protein product n=1 Tax=Phytophthora fragariaefolia TaxID=1490495 RepID=A0A9W6XSS1_9STRA|nr:unnamed protein product [Phytophthora fragariaefolia]